MQYTQVNIGWQLPQKKTRMALLRQQKTIPSNGIQLAEYEELNILSKNKAENPRYRKIHFDQT